MPIKPLISTLFKVTVFRDMLGVVGEIGTGTSSGTTNILDKEATTLPLWKQRYSCHCTCHEGI